MAVGWGRAWGSRPPRSEAGRLRPWAPIQARCGLLRSQPWARSVESAPNPDALALPGIPISSSASLCLPTIQAGPARIQHTGSAKTRPQRARASLAFWDCLPPEPRAPGAQHGFRGLALSHSPNPLPGLVTARPRWQACPAHTGPAPLGPLIETGAPRSEAVLLGGVIKGQEDVGAQTLAERSRAEPQARRRPQAFSRCPCQGHTGTPRAWGKPQAQDVGAMSCAPKVPTSLPRWSPCSSCGWPMASPAHLGDVRNKVLPEGQAAPDEPHGYDVMGQAHDVLIEPAEEKRRCWRPREGPREMCQEGGRQVRGAKTSGPSMSRGLQLARGTPRRQRPAGMHSQHLLRGVGIRQGNGKHAGVLLCCEVPVEVRQPGQSCNKENQ